MKCVNMVLLVVSAAVGSTQASADFNWLRDDTRSSQKVMNYLQEKNKSADDYLANLKPLQQELLSHWQSHAPTKAETPWRIIGDFEFKLNHRAGERVLLKRHRASKKTQMLLNIEQRAADHDFYQLSGWALSNNGQFLAVAEDLTGAEFYQITVIDLVSGQETLLTQNAEATVIWSADDKSVFTIEKGLQDSRPYKLSVRCISKPESEVNLYQELQKDWLVSAYVASDRRYALIQSNNESSSEQRVLNLQTGELSAPIKNRKQGVEYYADIAQGKLFINSNVEDQFALYQVALNSNKNWKKIYTPKPKSELNNFYLFESGVAVIERAEGQNSLVILPYQEGTPKRVSLASDGSVGWISRVGDYASNIIRIRTMSMVQPPKWEEFNVTTQQRTLLSQDTYSNYHASEYETQQIQVNSGGVQVPVTLAYKKSELKNDSPVILYGYGAYGFTMKPYFMPQITSLLDQGFIYAIAHVRGGGFNGEKWHQAGRGMNKQMGISDFLAATQTLKHFQQGNHPVLAMGSSAGGTLVAASINQQPTWYAGASLNVPFVDVVKSMSDESLPLTAQQYKEWGNPHIDSQIKTMRAYDPVVNVSSQPYPPMMVRVGWNDRRVPYWEGAKYLSKVEQLSSTDKPYLLLTDFQSGHATDRRKSLEQQAMDYAFLISQVKKSD